MNRIRKHRQKFFNFEETEIIEAFTRWQSQNRKNNSRMTVSQIKERNLKAKMNAKERMQKSQQEDLYFAMSATSKVFYHSKRWYDFRFKALQAFRNQCCSCGAAPESGAILHVDHIKPRSIYPEFAFSMSNIQILCEQCNLGKGINKTKVKLRQNKRNRTISLLVDSITLPSDLEAEE